jgi:hypothetical protein
MRHVLFNLKVLCHNILLRGVIVQEFVSRHKFSGGIPSTYKNHSIGCSTGYIIVYIRKLLLRLYNEFVACMDKAVKLIGVNIVQALDVEFFSYMQGGVV